MSVFDMIERRLKVLADEAAKRTPPPDTPTQEQEPPPEMPERALKPWPFGLP